MRISLDLYGTKPFSSAVSANTFYAVMKSTDYYGSMVRAPVYYYYFLVKDKGFNI